MMFANSRLMRALYAARSYTADDWRLFAVAAWALLRARLRLKEFSGRLNVQDGPPRTQAAENSQPTQTNIDTVKRVSWALNKVAVLAPFRSDCLVRSIAAFQLLEQRGLTPRFRVGVGFDEDGRFYSHAYTECEGIVVNVGSVGALTTILDGKIPFEAGQQSRARAVSVGQEP